MGRVLQGETANGHYYGIVTVVHGVEQALDDIPRAVDAGNDPDGVLLNAEFLRDTMLLEPLLPEEEGQALTGTCS